MKSTVNAKYHFRLKPSGLLMIRISYRCKDVFDRYRQLYMSTGINIGKHDFSPKTGLKQSAQLSDKKKLTTFMDNIIDKLEKLQREFVLDFVEPQELKTRFLTDDFTSDADKRVSLSGYITLWVQDQEKLTLNRLDDETLGIYNALADKIKDYGDIMIGRLTEEWIQGFMNHLGKTLRKNTVIKYWRKVKKICRMLKVALTDKEFSKKMVEEKTAKVYFSFEELQHIEKFKLKKPCERLERIRANFIFQAFTGMRYSDFIQQAEIQTINGKKYIIIDTGSEKTGEPIAIPVFAPVERMLKSGYLGKEISNQKYNDYLKEVIGEIYPDKTISVKYTLNGKEEKEVLYVKDKVGTHAGRRSFATNFTHLGIIPKKFIMEIVGIKKEVTFDNYIASPKVVNAEQMVNILQREQAKNPNIAYLLNDEQSSKGRKKKKKTS